MRSCGRPSTAEGSGAVRPLRRTHSSYGFIPKRGGSSTTAILERSFSFVSGPGHSYERDCSGTIRNVSGPVRFRIHTASSEAPLPAPSRSSDQGTAYKTTPRPKRAADQTRMTSSSRQVSDDSYQTIWILRWAGSIRRYQPRSWAGPPLHTASFDAPGGQAIRCSVPFPGHLLGRRFPKLDATGPALPH